MCTVCTSGFVVGGWVEGISDVQRRIQDFGGGGGV